MRHVSRTHRVARDWPLDRIILDPKIQVKYVDTKHQLGDKLIEGKCTRDEWNNLLHLFNISCTGKISKRIHEKKGEEVIVAKPNPTLNLVTHAAKSSSTVQSPIASKSLGILGTPCHLDWKSTGRLVAREHNQQDAASSFQARQKMQCWTRVRGDSWRQRRTRTSRISMKIWSVRGNSSLQETQISTVQAKCGHTISKYLLLTRFQAG